VRQWTPGIKVISATRPPRSASESGKPDQAKTGFTREEFEVMASFNSSKRGDSRGDQILEWAGNDAFQASKIRPLKMKSLQRKAVAEQVPDGVFRIDFTEPKDGAQKLIYYGRSLYEVCKELLRSARFAGKQYVQADVVYDGLGKRKLGALNRGEMYEGCQRIAGPRVSPVPIFLSSDTTILCKKMGGHPIIGVFKFSVTAVIFPSYYD
jgi:hypothetical protein